MSRLFPAQAVPHALIICSKVSHGPRASWTLHNTFCLVRAAQAPYAMPFMSVYVAVGRGGQDKERFDLGIVSPAGQVIFHGFFLVQDWGDCQAAEYAWDIKDLMLPSFGAYACRLIGENYPLCERKFFLKEETPE